MNLLELVQQTGINPKWAASTGGGKYHSACPQCGGVDRFYIQPNRKMSKCSGSYCCRQCGIYGDTIQFARQFLNYSFQEAAQIANAGVMEKNLYSTLKKSHISRPAILQKPPALWIEQAMQLVNQAHKNLLYNKDILAYLAKRGLPLEAVIRYKFGWSSNDKYLQRKNWGLSEQSNKNGKPSPLWIPKGLVIPTIESNNVIRLKVRRFDWNDTDPLPKYVAISGSMNGLNLMGSLKSPVMIVVESELDAFVLDYVAHDLVCIVAVGSNIKNPDNVTNRLAQNVKYLLICHDNDDAGNKMLNKWKKLYPHAIAYPTPIGKDIGEALQAGFQITEWILKIINLKSKIDSSLSTIHRQLIL